MDVSVFGLGYVGVVSCGCLAALGHRVIGVDVNPAKVAMVDAGTSPLAEAGIDELIAAGVRHGRLRATSDATAAVLETEVSLISVATPSLPSFVPDLRAVESVVRSIGMALRRKGGAHAVLVRSTVPPGTTEDRLAPILEDSAERRIGRDLSLAFNPEFLREGSSVRDFHHPAQTVVGSFDDAGYGVAERLYAGVDAPLVRTSVRAAEAMKVLCNVFHALKIVFANESGAVLKAWGLDGREVMRLLCQDTQLNISASYLRPGFAFGGSCLPKEVKGFLALARERGVDIPALQQLLHSNAAHIDRAYDMVARGGRGRIALFGLAFKPGTDDLRDSPLVALAERLLGRGFDLAIYDEFVEISRLLGVNKAFIDAEIPHLDRLLCDTPERALEGASVAVVGHASERSRRAIAARGEGLRVVDLCGCPDLARDVGRGYEGICW